MTSPEERFDWSMRAQPLGPPAADVTMQQGPVAPPGPVPEPFYWVPPESPPPKRRRGRLVLILAMVVLFTAAAATGATLLLTRRSAPAVDPKAAAIAACEKNLLITLKAPSTAKFSNESAFLSGDQYLVTGDVDAQNGFGAMLRKSWSCVASGAGAMWSGAARLTED